jgi:hypothetical protein
MFLHQNGRKVACDPGLGKSGRRGLPDAKVEAVVAGGVTMPRREVLRRHVRYYSDGALPGTAEPVNAVFTREQALRGRFGEKRTITARPMRGADRGDLRMLRDLGKNVIGPRIRSADAIGNERFPVGRFCASLRESHPAHSGP